jgi:transcriptional regulator with XRE-family HTH domain
MRDLDKAFGLAVRQRRTELSISQEELGYRAGIHRTYISQIERGIKSPSLKVIALLAKALQTDAYRLVQMAERTQRSSTQPGDNDVSANQPGNPSES